MDDNLLLYDYDKYNKQLGDKLKIIEDEEKLYRERAIERKEFHNNMNLDKIQINQLELKCKFCDILLLEDSSRYLWILNSKYTDNTYQKSYLDVISEVFEKSNKVIRKGINTYKVNGWMTHVLYVYQIVNYNIANNIMLKNFEEDNQKSQYVKKYIDELHQVYEKLDNTSRFILKLICLIHDIGVIESVKDHAICGKRYVNKVIEDIGITQQFLDVNNFNITFDNLIEILKNIIENHLMYSLLSEEASDKEIEKIYKDFIKKIPSHSIKLENISSIILLFTIADIIAVNENIFNNSKYELIKEAYVFFNEVIQNLPHNRKPQEVATKRICDFIGQIDEKSVQKSAEIIMRKLKIDIDKFWLNMFNIKRFYFWVGIFKELNDLEITIKILNALFDIIETKFNTKALENTTITWIPNNKEKQFIKSIKNNTFFECINVFKYINKNEYVTNENKMWIEVKDKDIQLNIETL